MKNLFSWLKVFGLCGLAGSIGSSIGEFLVQKIETKKRKEAIQDIIDKAIKEAKKQGIDLNEELINKVED